MNLNNNYIAEFPSLNEAERITGCPRQVIRKVCNGKAKLSGGYKWKFKV